MLVASQCGRFRCSPRTGRACQERPEIKGRSRVGALNCPATALLPVSPTHYSKYAERAFPFRWWLGALALCIFALLALLAMFGTGPDVQIAAAIAGPLIGLPWAGLCAAIWFHPVKGNMQPSSRLVGRLPRPLQSGLRWYASAFLSVIVITCAVVWPLFAMTLR